MSASVGRVLDVARSQIGTRASAGNRNKYAAAYGLDGQAWCAMFQWWVFREAGASELIPKTAWTPSFYAWFAARGRASTVPQVGALVFFNWPGDGVNRIQHIGIVEAVHPDGTITTIEGNTSSGTAGSQGNGGGVWRRRRSGSSIVGYGMPAYAAASAPPPRPLPSPAPAFDPSTLRSLSYGMKGDEGVKGLQRFLNAYPWSPELPLLPVTGNYLDQTAAVVKRAGQQVGVSGPDVDGRDVGPRFKAAFAARGARW